MDLYSSDGELADIHSAFHQGQYEKVLDLDTSDVSDASTILADALKFRSQIALSRFDKAIDELEGKKDTKVEYEALSTLAEHLKQSGESESVVETAKKLATEHNENLIVQLCAGIVLANAGLAEETLALLGNHGGSLDAVALIVQIHLQQNRLDLATQEIARAKKWAQDSLLVNIAESWVGLREGGEKYQQAFYVFEEMAQTAATQSVRSLVGQAISELHLGRYPEAEAVLQQALELDAASPDVLANTVVLNAILGKDSQDLRAKLSATRPDHPMVSELQARSAAFDEARKKYTPSF